MIQSFKKTLAVGAVAVGMLLARPTEAQVSPLNLNTLTNVPSPLAASSGTVSNGVFLLTRDCDLAFAAQFFTTNGTGTATVAGSFSLDTTNFGLSPFVLTGTALSNNLAAVTGGTNIPPVTVYTNWQHAAIAGYTAVIFNGFTNGASTSSLFNGGAKINRPTINTATY